MSTMLSENRTRRRERFSYLLLLSILTHGALILLITFFFAREFVRHKDETQPPPPEVTLEIPPPEMHERPFIEAKHPVDKKQDNPLFESDEHTKASSEQSPDGSLPPPSQQGIKQSALELQNQKHTEGEKPATEAGNPGTAAQQPPQQAATPAPTPASTPEPTPTPQPSPDSNNAKPPPNNVKLIEPTSTPKPPSPNMPPSAPGTPGSRKGYQPETRQTVIHGNISNRGPSSVAAEATPLGRYKKAAADAIGSRWYYYVNERMGLLSVGTVSVSFKVSATGKVTGLHVISNNSNQSLTDCSLRSIMDAKLPPIPPEVAATLQNGTLEIDYSFTIY